MVFEGPIRLALHKLKYRRNLGLGDALAHHMQAYVRTLSWSVDVVVPVPLGKARLQERGYNQVALVARPLTELNHWQYCPAALSRARETRSQVGLNALERKENVSGAFWADPERMGDRGILLMDDVVTTGATLAACAQACLQAGARQVFALSLARALLQHGYQTV
jgi:ComF family protein